jgi:hypothetical protein
MLRYDDISVFTNLLFQVSAMAKNPAHRPKGALNLFTKDIKSAMLEAFAEGGGKTWLKRQMKTEPRAFMALLAKCMPSEVKATVQVETQTVIIDFVGLPRLKHDPLILDASIPAIPAIIDNVVAQDADLVDSLLE